MADRKDELRGPGLVIDLERLEAHAEDLYLTRFVDHVRKTRGEHGRYLRLRPGDETAIIAAGDGSAESLDQVRASSAVASQGDARTDRR